MDDAAWLLLVVHFCDALFLMVVVGLLFVVISSVVELLASTLSTFVEIVEILFLISSSINLGFSDVALVD